jgi:hypothetical protein
MSSISRLPHDLQKEVTGYEHEGLGGETLVKTKDGYVRMCDIKIDDLVLTLDGFGEICESKVISIDRLFSPTCAWCNIHNSNELFSVGQLQKFFTRESGINIHGGWIMFKDINSSNKFMSSNGEVFFNSNGYVEGGAFLYGIKVEENHNFFITKNDLLTHNFPLLSLATFVPISAEIVEALVLAFKVGITLCLASNEIRKGVREVNKASVLDTALIKAAKKENVAGSSYSDKTSSGDLTTTGGPGGPKKPKKDDDEECCKTKDKELKKKDSQLTEKDSELSKKDSEINKLSEDFSEFKKHHSDCKNNNNLTDLKKDEITKLKHKYIDSKEQCQNHDAKDKKIDINCVLDLGCGQEKTPTNECKPHLSEFLQNAVDCKNKIGCTPSTPSTLSKLCDLVKAQTGNAVTAVVTVTATSLAKSCKKSSKKNSDENIENKDNNTGK